MQRRQHVAALIIQANWKRHRGQLQFARSKQAAVTIQVRHVSNDCRHMNANKLCVQCMQSHAEVIVSIELQDLPAHL